MGMQRLVDLVFPPQCVLCDEPLETAWGLCPSCWADTPFIMGHACDDCGAPLIGEAEESDLCDACLQTPRPWTRGRAAMVYAGNARKMVMRFKHGDRTDLARPAGDLLARAIAPLVREDTLLVPIPIHWRRMMRRKFNQAALLAATTARKSGVDHAPRALIRTHATAAMENMTGPERFANVGGSIEADPKHGKVLRDRHVILVDDVMTSGATLSVATEACIAAGATQVDIGVLARVAKDV